MSTANHIYRVQAADGRGPWRPGFSHVWIDDDGEVGHLEETVMDLLPISTLANLPPTHHYGCGCRTLDALMEWFTPLERKRLERLGFRPVRMDVDLILAESARQVFFGRTRPLNDRVTFISWRKRQGV